MYFPSNMFVSYLDYEMLPCILVIADSSAQC